jgi:RNA polymerase sigma-70 factor (ECF subfamily)
MAPNARTHRQPSLQGKVYNQPAWHRLRRLRHLHPLSRERQIALVRRTRRARPPTQPSHGSSVETPLRDQMLELLPNLRAFAFSLTNDPTRVDDLVQDAFLRAWANIDRFERGSNLGAWLFTILRHAFYTQHRKRRREVEDPDSGYARRLMVQPEQEFGLMLEDLQRALAHLPLEQREALILVGGQGETYEDAAVLCGVPVGTIKSRVNRARTQLAELLRMDDRHDIGLDRLIQAALQESRETVS